MDLDDLPDTLRFTGADLNNDDKPQAFVVSATQTKPVPLYDISRVSNYVMTLNVRDMKNSGLLNAESKQVIFKWHGQTVSNEIGVISSPSRPPVTTPLPEPAMTQIHRFYNGTDHFLTVDYNEGIAGGYSYEGPTFKVYKDSGTGRVRLYRCRIANGDHFESLGAGCEGQIAEGALGWISTQPSGKRPIYRCRQPGGFGDHMTTPNQGECIAAGWFIEATLGYVP